MASRISFRGRSIPPSHFPPRFAYASGGSVWAQVSANIRQERFLVESRTLIARCHTLLPTRLSEEVRLRNLAKNRTENEA